MNEMTTNHLRAKLRALLIKHEGACQKVYYDISGVPSIGVGRNLLDRGVLPDEIELMLKNDIEYFHSALSKLNWFNALNEARQIAMLDMAFNLGVKGLLSFKRMIAALENHDYQMAAVEALDSKWAKQVPGRANEIADIILTGRLSGEFF